MSSETVAAISVLIFVLVGGLVVYGWVGLALCCIAAVTGITLYASIINDKDEAETTERMEKMK